MKTWARIFLSAALVLSSALSTYAERKLLVTEQVLAEYVEDRLDQLQGREKLDEEEVLELKFIRQNRHNLREVADFYGMKIKEERPRKIFVGKESSVRGVEEKSIKESSQSRPAIPDTVELARQGEPIEPTLTETPQPEEKTVGFALNEEMPEGKRAKKHGRGNGKAISPVEISSPPAESKTRVSAQKSIHLPNHLNYANDLKDPNAPRDIKGKSVSVVHLPNAPVKEEERILQRRPPSLIAREEEVVQFFAHYAERYARKDIDGFLSLFSPKAVQNQRDGFDEIKKMYSDFFHKSRELRYHIEGIKIDIYQNAVEAKGRYHVDQIVKRRGKKKVIEGDIRWILVRENGALKIRYLDYGNER